MSSTRRIPLTNMTDGQLVNLGLQSVDGVAIRGKMFKPSGMSSRRREMTESEKSRFRPITLAPDEKVKLQPGTTLVYTDEDDRIIRTELIGPQVARVRGIAGMKLYTDPSPDNQDAVDAQMREWDELYGPISSPQRQARGRGGQPDRTAREQGRPRTTNEDPIDRILRETEEARGRRGMSSRTDTYKIFGEQEFERILDDLELSESEKEIAREQFFNSDKFTTREILENTYDALDEIKNLLSDNPVVPINKKTKDAIESISIKVSSNGIPVIFAQPHPDLVSILPDRDWSQIEAPSVDYMKKILPNLIKRFGKEQNRYDVIFDNNKMYYVNSDGVRVEDPLDKFKSQMSNIMNEALGLEGDEVRLRGSWVQQYVGLLLNPGASSEVPDVEHDIMGNFGTGRGFDRHGEWANAMAITSFILDSDLLDLSEYERNALAFWWLSEYGISQIMTQINSDSGDNQELHDFIKNSGIGHGTNMPFDGSARELISILDGENLNRQGMQSKTNKQIRLVDAPIEQFVDAQLEAGKDRVQFIIKSTFIPQKDRLRLTDAQKQRIAELNAEGLTDMQIARELGISKESVIRVRKKGNIPAANRPSKNEERNKKIISMVKQGMTHTQIAKELGIHKQSVMDAVLRHARDTGENYSSFDARDIPRRKKIIELNKLGKTDVEIAREVGVSPNTVGRIRKQEGLTINFPGKTSLDSSD